MAELAEYRVYKRKRLKDPTDENNYLDIPVLYEMRFKTIQEQAQETYLYIDNSSNSSRKVHTKRVTNSQDSSQYIDVERIDEWNVKTVQEQAQELTFVLTNTDPPPMQPDGSNNPAHEQTHIVRFFKDNDSNSDTWCDVELIDELKIKCIQEQAQEYIFYLKHPTLLGTINDPDVPYVVTEGYCDPSFELVGADSGIDPPYRTDIFSNIVNIKWFSEESSVTSDCYPFDGDYAGFAASINWLRDPATGRVYDATVGDFVEFGIAYADMAVLAAQAAVPNESNVCGAYWFIGTEGVYLSAYLKPISEPCGGLSPCNPVETPQNKAIPPEWWE